MDKTQLEQRLAEVQAKIDRQTPHSNQNETSFFHLGMVGTGGRNAQKLNQYKLERMDRSIDKAVTLNELYAERESLQRQLDEYESKVARQQVRQAQRDAALERIRTAKPGMQAITMFGNPVEIQRVNRKSITTTSGSRYTFEDLVDVMKGNERNG
jgi:DNA repair exonuclease SbcCD ATPase subunit